VVTLDIPGHRGARLETPDGAYTILVDADGSGIDAEGVSAAAELVVQLPASGIPGSDGTGSDTGPRMVHVGDTDPQQDGVTWIDANGCASDAS
jgi:hypothetical protein